MAGPARAILPPALILSVTASAHAQRRTDVVTLANGDRITGEVGRLERGRLEFKTDVLRVQLVRQPPAKPRRREQRRRDRRLDRLDVLTYY